MVVLLNQTRLIPIYVDIVGIRSPRRTATDEGLLLRALHSELYRSSFKGKIAFRKGKRRSVQIKAKVIDRSLNDRLYAVVLAGKRLKKHYVRMEFVSSKIRKRSILYVVMPRDALFEEPENILLKLKEPVMTLKDAAEGYKAVVLVIEDLGSHIPSRALIESLKNDVYVMRLESQYLAYRPLRYTI